MNKILLIAFVFLFASCETKPPASTVIYEMVKTEVSHDTAFIHDTVYIQTRLKVIPKINTGAAMDSLIEFLPTPEGFIEIPKDSAFDWQNIIDSLYKSKDSLHYY